MLILHKYLVSFITLVGLFFTFAIQPSHAQTKLPSMQDEQTVTTIAPTSLIEAAISNALEVGRLGKIKFSDTPGMRAFYQDRGYSPAWIKGSFINGAKTKDILAVFEDSWRHGLNPNNYHVAEIRHLLEKAEGTDQFELELVISDALVRYGHDMTGMRIKPSAIKQRSKYWRKPLLGYDVLTHMAKNTNTTDALHILAPQGNLYKRLQEELINLYKTPADNKKRSRLSAEGVIRPGSTSARVGIIRQRMGAGTSAPKGKNYYDDGLAQTVMAFQRAHGLKPDGIIGAHTVKLMNMTRKGRINQVLANLERLRWVEPNKPERYVMVNVPSATLWAVDKGSVKLEMPVIVGRAKRPTNIFSTTITGVRINPTWTVPPTIKKDDYLPKLKNDPYYLSKRGIELMSKGKTVDPGTINWKTVPWGTVNGMQMVQGPGKSNPLGRFRVIMNNPYNIYLHDTPNKTKFSRSDRALSSGCIRMSDPEKFTDFVLSPNSNWSESRKKQLLDAGKKIDVAAESPLPVYILYQTVWLGNGGQIVYGADIYDHDKQLIRELKKVGGLAIQEIKMEKVASNNNLRG